MNDQISVLLAEDHSLVRAGICRLINDMAGIHVVAEAGDGEVALAMMAEKNPDVALLDITMPRLDGLETAARVAQQFPAVKVIMLSMHNSREMVAEALRAGAAGYLLKESATVELELAIRTVINGDTYLSPPVSRHLVDQYVGRVGSTLNPLDSLTTRQYEVFMLLVRGLTTRAIAQRLGISPKTVEQHRLKLMDQLKIRDMAGLFRLAVRLGISLDEEPTDKRPAPGPAPQR